MSSSTAPHPTDRDSGIEVEVLPFVRVPILDRNVQLAAYDIRHQATEGGDSLASATLQLFGLVSLLEQLTGSQLSFLAVDEELLRRHAELLRFDGRLGPRVDADLAVCDDAYAALRGMATRGVPVMIDNLVWGNDLTEASAARLEELAQLASHVSIDPRRYDDATLQRSVARLRAADVAIVASCLEDHSDHSACMDLGFDYFEGPYHFKPPPKSAGDTLKPSRLNVLRLLAAVQDPENGPVELEQLIRNDAVLSYKLLACVNSAYFGLPRELKSLQQAAVFFGVTRIRNWVYAMALGDLDDASPEVLKQALLRARMGELLSRHMRPEYREMCFTMGLFSLLDTIMGIPMERVLADVPVADEVRDALVGSSGPLGPVLQQIRAWESGHIVRATGTDGLVVDLAEAYLDSLEWAEHVYSHAQRKVA
jgi:EAL and modified HD-GYP domain-containing signal transduction protein